MNSKQKEIINRTVSIYGVFEKVLGYRPSMSKIICPYHDDHNPSAKIFHDTDGDRVYCFTCNRQYTVVDILLIKNVDLKEWLPKSYSVEEVEKKEIDYSYLNSFKEGGMDIGNFCEQLYRKSVSVDAK